MVTNNPDIESPAARVINRFGGQSELARLLDKRPSTVQYWASTGRIPPRWHAQLLKLAQSKGVDLSPTELVALPEADPSPTVPVAQWAGVLSIGNNDLPCYVLSDGRRIISRRAATTSLTGGKGGGNLESYIGVRALDGFLPNNFADHLIEFTLEGVTNVTSRGITAESFCDVCTAYVSALVLVPGDLVDQGGQPDLGGRREKHRGVRSDLALTVAL